MLSGQGVRGHITFLLTWAVQNGKIHAHAPPGSDHCNRSRAPLAQACRQNYKVVYSLRREGDCGTLIARGGHDREGNLYITAEAGGALSDDCVLEPPTGDPDFEEAVMGLKSVIKLHRANSITRASPSKSRETYEAYAKATCYAGASGADYWRDRAPVKTTRRFFSCRRCESNTESKTLK